MGSDENDDEGAEIVKPDQCEDAKSDRSRCSFREDFGASEISEDPHDSAEDAEVMTRIATRKKTRTRSWGWNKRTHNQLLADDSTCSGDDPQDDNTIEVRRLRRKLRGPWNRRSSLVFEDRGCSNTSNNVDQEEPQEGVIGHTKESPSIPLDEVFNLDELPFWGGAYETMEVMSDDEDKHQDFRVGAASPTDSHASHRPGRAGAAMIDQDIVDIEDDRRSTISAASSTTLVSTLSGFTVVELDSATIALQNIFQGDADLVELYRRAIKDPTIGPERLQRNIGRLLKLFARDLRREASEELQKMTSNFVSMKATFIAQCITEEYNNHKIEPKLQKSKTERNRGGKTRALELGTWTQEDLQDCPVEDRGITRDDNKPVADQYDGDINRPKFGAEQLDDDDLDRLAPIDEDYFEDLLVLRAFLVNSTAFQTFRQELTKFVLPKELRSSHAKDGKQDSATNTTLTSRWLVPDVVESAVESVLVSTGLLEPPLRPAMIRLRWQCNCGDTFFEDVTEYRAGGVSELMEEMRPCCSKITAAAFSESSSKPTYSSASFNIVRLAWRKIMNCFRKDPVSTITPSQDHGPQIAGEDVEAESAFPSTQTLLLLAGLHKWQDTIFLAQDDVEKVETDRELFCFMREQLDSRYNSLQKFFSTTRVKDIHFCKLCLRVNNNLEPLTHHPCCTNQLWSECKCVPPASRVEGGSDPEYRCNPAGPLKRWPPVLSRHLVHSLRSPACVGEHDKTVLQKIPRRICGKLQAENDQEAEGWGIYYEEGPNLLWVAVLTSMVASLTALLFGILWATLKKDLQGAFGVSGYVGTVCAAIVPLLAWYQNS